MIGYYFKSCWKVKSLNILIGNTLAIIVKVAHFLCKVALDRLPLESTYMKLNGNVEYSVTFMQKCAKLDHNCRFCLGCTALSILKMLIYHICYNSSVLALKLGPRTRLTVLCYNGNKNSLLRMFMGILGRFDAFVSLE